MLKSLLQTLNNLAGPKGGIIEKCCMAFFMFAAGKGWIGGDTATALSALAYGLISTALTGATQTETAKILAINDNDTNGVKVVKETAAAPSVDAPVPVQAA